MIYKLACSREIEDLGPSCNGRHVRNSLPRLEEEEEEEQGRVGAGEAFRVLFFCYIKLRGVKAGVGGSYRPVYVPLKAPHLTHSSLYHLIFTAAG